MKLGKKRCSKCGGFFAPQGLPHHFDCCEGQLAEIRAKGGKKKATKKKAWKKATRRKATKKKVVKKDRFIVFDRDDWFADASSLQRAEDLASEMLENDVDEDDIKIFKVVAEYKVEKIKKAVLILKAKK